jgi:hypothetical protein
VLIGGEHGHEAETGAAAAHPATAAPPTPARL